jgi:DNA-binding transcriptional regulator YhcF (GntR family)
MLTAPEQRFVSIPYLTSEALKNLDYKDVLIYTALKSFNNSDLELCFPSLKSIARKAGMCVNFARDAIRRLGASGWIYQKKGEGVRKASRYFFPHLDWFNKVPFDFFDITDLTPYEKSMLLCLYQFFVLQGRTTYVNLQERADHLGLTYKTVHQQYNNLITKGYLVECVKAGRKYTMTLSEKMRLIYPKRVEEYRSKVLDTYSDDYRLVLG